MGYTRKTKDEYVIQGNYAGYGWEDVSTYDIYREALTDYKEYVLSDKTARFRIVKRRVKIEA